MPATPRRIRARRRPILRTTHPAVLEPLESRRLLAGFTLYVDDSAPAHPAPDGLSWSTAYRDLQHALDAANPATGDSYEIRIAQGTYYPSARTVTSDPRSVTFKLKDNVALLGGYAGFGAADPEARHIGLHPTILSGDINVAGDSSADVRTVVTTSYTKTTAILDGVSVTGGARGISNDWGSPTVRNCAIRGNDGGGGIYNQSGSPFFINCTISDNRLSNGEGAGMATHGGSPTLINCTVAFNTAGTTGLAAIYNRSSSLKIINSIVWHNSNAAIFGNAADITHSNIEGSAPGEGNIELPPLFLSESRTALDLRLRLDSPCIDAGDNRAIPAGIDTDLIGGPRFHEIVGVADTGIGEVPLVDMGAYEANHQSIGWRSPDAGGPYATFSGDVVRLLAYAETNQLGGSSFAWDFDGDGDFDDATGPAPLFVAPQISRPVILPIALRVIDTAGVSRTDVSEVTVTTPVAHVDDSATGNNSGTAWADAYTSLQQALVMSAPGQIIRVAQGTYRPTDGTDRTVSFHLRNGVTLQGGYAGLAGGDPDARDTGAYSTVLSGDIGIPNDNSDNSYHVVVASGVDATTVLDGFTITAGNANGDLAGPQEKRSGGGMYNRGGSPVLRNCLFTGNRASTYGGGVYNAEKAQVTFIACAFIGNATQYCGGGIYITAASPTLNACSFTGNMASLGGGVGVQQADDSPTLSDCTFSGNSAERGGGLYAANGALMLVRCTFVANTAIYGGGIWTSGMSAQPPMILRGCIFSRNAAVTRTGGGGVGGAVYTQNTAHFTDCSFTGNDASHLGGAIGTERADVSSSALVNCVLVGNRAGVSGGAIHGSSTSTIALINCVLSSNTAGESGGAIATNAVPKPNQKDPQLANCIVWGNSAPTSAQIAAASALFATHSIIQGGYPGTAIFDADPLFLRNPGPGPDKAWGTADDDYGDLRLQRSSPAIDSGSNPAAASVGTIDFAGNPRFADTLAVPDTGAGAAPVIDLGAYECPGWLTARAGGPYSVQAGQSITLAGQGQGDVPGPLLFDWDFDADGEFDDASGPSPVFPAAGLMAPLSFALALRITDASGASTIDTAILLVTHPLLYVDDSATTGASDGSSWADAFTSLQTALAVASPGHLIRVAQGTYRPTDSADRAASFQLRNQIIVEGGYAGLGAVNPDARNAAAWPSILSGDIGVPGDGADNSLHVVSAASGTDLSATLDGFVITAGNASGPGADGLGGGMYLKNASPSIRNSTFIANAAINRGGGIYAESASPAVLACAFLGNTANNGGGLYVSGGSPLLLNCRIVGNAVRSYGGGLYCASSSTASLINCTIVANAAILSSGRGGGLYSSSASPTITNCILTANQAPSSPQIHAALGSPVIGHSLIAGGCSGGSGIVDADPRFVRNPSAGPDGIWGTANDDYGDLRLQLDSPVIDAGANAAVPAGMLEDISGNPRFLDIPARPDSGVGDEPMVDMGAYESTSHFEGQDLHLRRGSGTGIELWRSVGDSAYPIAAGIPFSVIGRLTLDFSAGNPLGDNPIIFHASDSGVMALVNLPPGAALALSAGSLAVDGRAIALSGIASVQLDTSASLASLKLEDASRLTLAAGKGLELHTASLAMAPTALLDLADGRCTVQPVDPAEREQLLEQVVARLASARNASPRWSGPGITSGVVKADGGDMLTLAAISGDDRIIVRQAIQGDLDDNGRIDGDDYYALDRAYLSGKAPLGPPSGDLDYSSRVDGTDYLLLDRAFLVQVPPGQAGLFNAGAAIASRPADPAERDDDGLLRDLDHPLA